MIYADTFSTYLESYFFYKNHFEIAMIDMYVSNTIRSNFFLSVGPTNETNPSGCGLKSGSKIHIYCRGSYAAWRYETSYKLQSLKLKF